MEAQEFEYIPGEDVIDISTSVSCPLEDNTEVEILYDENNQLLDPLYYTVTESEEALVSRILDGELQINEQNIHEVFNLSSLPEGNESDSKEGKVIQPKREKGLRAVRKLPPALKGLMGEANLRFARGETEMAVKICLEIIRQVPTNPEPFLTLAAIYEEMGDSDKSLQMNFVAAHLAPTDSLHWAHLGEMFQDQGDTRKAISCLTKAINKDIQNMDLHRKRASLLQSIGDNRTAIRGYFKLLGILNPGEGDYLVSVAKFVAELCHRENDLEKANEALETAIAKCSQLINLEFVNLHLELLIQMRRYHRCLEIMKDFCGLKIEIEGEIVKVCELPSVPFDIRAKLVAILIHLKADTFVNKILEPILKLSPDDVGELYLDIAEAYTEEGLYEEATNLLGYLLTGDVYNLPAVWLKYADNLRYGGSLEAASEAYSKVLEQAPQHIEVRLTLSSILVTIGRPQEAINVLEQSDNENLDAGLLYERCILMKSDPSLAVELILLASLLFSRHALRIRNQDELSTISTIQRYDRKRQAVRQVRRSKNEPEGDLDSPEFRKEGRGPTPEEEWDLFKYVSEECVRLRLNHSFQRIVFTAQLSTLFAPHKMEIDILSVVASYLNGDSHSGYNIIRTLVVKHPSNVKLWHLFNLNVSKSEHARHNRFIMRQLSSNSCHPALGPLHGNNCLVSGTYKYAMHEYSSSYMKEPTPLLAFLLGLTYLQMAAQKFTSKKHQLVLQAEGMFSDYKTRRGPDGLQESHYNLGRGYHHLGLFTPAIFHYKKVLDCPPNELARRNADIFDLKREAAFNLHLIYCQSESYDLAKLYLENYVII